MKTTDFPIEIDGKKYFVDRTFAGYPAIYVFKDGGFRNISAFEFKGHDPRFAEPRDGDTIIMATFNLEKGDDSPSIQEGLIDPMAKAIELFKPIAEAMRKAGWI